MIRPRRSRVIPLPTLVQLSVIAIWVTTFASDRHPRSIAATWRSLRDVRVTFPTADGIPVRTAGGATVVVTCFNVKGNEYRLLTFVSYERQTVAVVDVLTHAEYGTGRWKGRI